MSWPIPDHLIERFEGSMHFVHSERCPNYCDYACNRHGFEEAEKIEMCDHKFIDSKHCLKCGWEPTREQFIAGSMDAAGDTKKGAT